MHRVLITGGSGFIGSHLAERLVAEGYAVRVFDARPYPYPLPESAFEVVGELTVLAEVQEAARDCNGIIHLAAVSRVRESYEQPWQCIATNVMGTANVLEAAQLASKSPWIVLGSTREVPERPESILNLANLYGITKFIAELCARRYAEDYGLRVLTLRFSDVYGSERDHPGKVLPLFVQKALRGEPITLREPMARFDFTYFQDVLSGILQGVEYIEACPSGIYDSMTLCTGQAVTLKELAETIVTELGSASPIEVHPVPANGQDMVLENDPSRAQEKLGFRAQFSLREGIRRLAAALPDDTGERIR